MEHSVQESLFQPLPTVEELRRALELAEGEGVRAVLNRLFDEGTFVELGVYAKRSFNEYAEEGRTNEFEGVITGYGAIEGMQVYAFAQDFSRMKGAVDETHAKKICAIYELALKNGVPVIGIFDSAGADVYEGVSALAAYGRIMKTVARASGKVPQLAIVNGHCIGTAAAIAAMFDMLVCTKGSDFYVNDPTLGAKGEAMEALCTLRAENALDAADKARMLLYYFPACAGEGVWAETPEDSPERMLGELDWHNDPHNLLSALTDNGGYLEIYGDYAYEVSTVLTKIAGVRCGVITVSSASGGRISAKGACKASRFVSLLDAFGIPLVTLLDSCGFAVSAEDGRVPFAADIGRLAAAYAISEMPKVTVVLGKAIGGAYAVMGSKAIGADVAYALERAEIGALPADASVAFAWNSLITIDKKRGDLEKEWHRSLSSPVAAAAKGEIDDIITMDELRMRVSAALLMLINRGDVHFRHPVRPI